MVTISAVDNPFYERYVPWRGHPSYITAGSGAEWDDWVAHWYVNDTSICSGWHALYEGTHAYEFWYPCFLSVPYSCATGNIVLLWELAHLPEPISQAQMDRMTIQWQNSISEGHKNDVVDHFPGVSFCNFNLNKVHDLFGYDPEYIHDEAAAAAIESKYISDIQGGVGKDNGIPSLPCGLGARSVTINGQPAPAGTEVRAEFVNARYNREGEKEKQNPIYMPEAGWFGGSGFHRRIVLQPNWDDTGGFRIPHGLPIRIYVNGKRAKIFFKGEWRDWIPFGSGMVNDEICISTDNPPTFRQAAVSTGFGRAYDLYVQGWRDSAGWCVHGREMSLEDLDSVCVLHKEGFPRAPPGDIFIDEAVFEPVPPYNTIEPGKKLRMRLGFTIHGGDVLGGSVAWTLGTGFWGGTSYTFGPKKDGERVELEVEANSCYRDGSGCIAPDGNLHASVSMHIHEDVYGINCTGRKVVVDPDLTLPGIKVYATTLPDVICPSCTKFIYPDRAYVPRFSELPRGYASGVTVAVVGTQPDLIKLPIPTTLYDALYGPKTERQIAMESKAAADAAARESVIAAFHEEITEDYNAFWTEERVAQAQADVIENVWGGFTPEMWNDPGVLAQTQAKVFELAPAAGAASVTPETTVVQTQAGAGPGIVYPPQTESVTPVPASTVIPTTQLYQPTSDYITTPLAPTQTSYTSPTTGVHTSPSTILVGDTAPFSENDPAYASIMGYEVTSSNLPLVIGAGIVAAIGLYFVMKNKK